MTDASGRQLRKSAEQEELVTRRLSCLSVSAILLSSSKAFWFLNLPVYRRTMLINKLNHPVSIDKSLHMETGSVSSVGLLSPVGTFV